MPTKCSCESLYRMFFSGLFLAGLICSLAFSGCAASDSSGSRYWPNQELPTGLIRTVPHEDFEPLTGPEGNKVPGSFAAEHVMVQSISGLAARAVNQGRLDELVWITVGSPDGGLNIEYDRSFQWMVNKFDIEDRGVFSSWELIDRYSGKGIIKGYVLYSYDHSEGDAYEQRRENIDESVNAATMMASLLNGVLIEESMEEQAKEHGLELLYDARGVSVSEVFAEHKDKFNPRVAVTADPKAPNLRDTAIAYNLAVSFDTEEQTDQLYDWLEPPGTILGWNWGAEVRHTDLVSTYGHFHTASNWTLNLPFFLACQKEDVPPVEPLDPQKIDFDSDEINVSFVMSDGDNLSWMLSDFTDHHYWANEHSGEFPFGWGIAAANLRPAGSAVLDYLNRNRPQSASYIDFAGGYFFPDRFAVKRGSEERERLLRKKARRIWDEIEPTGIRTIKFICLDIDSKEAMQAYKIFAEEMDGLIGMFAMQYHPYEAGAGKTYWVENRKGMEIPVVTPKFAIWDTTGTGRGDPLLTAERINNLAKGENAGKKNIWTVIHAWSEFPQLETNRGLDAVKLCVDKLDDQVRVVNPEELLWRIRMEKRPEQTKILVNQQ